MKIDPALLFAPSRVSPEGQQAGRVLAAFAETGIETGVPDRRCGTCAFRMGTVPNGCLQTMADAAKCLAEGEVFECHHREGATCEGFRAASMVYPPEMRGPVDWDFAKLPEENEHD
jgi:hypothetical protein